MINSVVLVGRLGNDPEMTYLDSGMALAKFRLAVQRPPRRGGEQEGGDRGQSQDTDWLDIVAWGRQAETCHQYLKKGALVGVEGRVQSRTWERQDGTKGYGVEINARRVQFLESRRDREAREAAEAAASESAPPSEPPPADQAPEPSQAPPAGDTGPSDEEEDPFGDQ